MLVSLCSSKQDVVQGLEARVGFEPTVTGFAVPRIRPLCHRAIHYIFTTKPEKIPERVAVSREKEKPCPWNHLM